MAVLVQEQIKADYSFILHSRDPFSTDKESVYGEVAIGLGETLASGNQQGTPYRLASDGDKCEVKAFANYSEAVVSGGKVKIDYTTVALSAEPTKLTELGLRFARIAKQIEKAYKGVAQDIEGALVSTGEEEFKVLIVQSRTQI